MFLFDKIFNVGAYIFLHILQAPQQRRSVGAAINTVWAFWVPCDEEGLPSTNPGSCVTWPLGGMTGKQIKIIFCAGPGFHLPVRRPSAGTLQSLGLTHSSPQQGCLPRWLRFSLPINPCDNRQQARQLLQLFCAGCIGSRARDCAVGSSRCPADALSEGWWKRWLNLCLGFVTRSYLVTQLSSLSQSSDSEGESFFSSTRHLSLPSRRNLSNANAWNCTNNNFGNKWMQSLPPRVKASAISVAWSSLNTDSAPMVGPLPQPHQLWDSPRLMPSGRKAGIEALEHGYEHPTLGKKRLRSCVYYHHTHISVGRGKNSLLKWFDLTDASPWKQLVKPSWSVL